MTHRPPATAPDEPLDDLGDLARALGGDETSFTGDLLRLVAKAQAPVTCCGWWPRRRHR